MSGKKMGSGKVTIDFLFEKRIHSNKRIFWEIFRNVFQWDTFLIPGDSCVPFELKFSCLMQGTSSINQGAEHSHFTHHICFMFFHAIVSTSFLGKLFTFS